MCRGISELLSFSGEATESSVLAETFRIFLSTCQPSSSTSPEPHPRSPLQSFLGGTVFLNLLLSKIISAYLLGNLSTAVWKEARR